MKLAGGCRCGAVSYIWVKHKQPWLSLPATLATWPESPTPEAFAAALSARD